MCMFVCECVCVSHSVMSYSLHPLGLYSPPGSSVHGTSQARIPEWLPCPPPGDLPDPRINPGSPSLQADSLPPEPPGKPKENVSSYLFFFFFLGKKQTYN